MKCAGVYKVVTFWGNVECFLGTNGRIDDNGMSLFRVSCERSRALHQGLLGGLPATEDKQTSWLRLGSMSSEASQMMDRHGQTQIGQPH